MSATKKTHTLYRIYYGDHIVYVGRTNQPLSTRIRGHLLAKPMHRKLSIDLITKIEYAEFESEADMNLYEIYFILLLHPALNVDDKTKDFPTVHLPDVEFKTASFANWNKWKQQIKEMEVTEQSARARARDIREQLHVLRSSYHMGEMTEDEYYNTKEALEEELKSAADTFR